MRVARHRKVIIVEDEPDVLELVNSVASGEGFEVRPATSLDACREAMRSFDASVFIIDVGLPDGSGLSILPEIRTRGNVGILILSGHSGEVDQVLGLELGADDYVTKPFRPRELAARLRALYRRVAATSDDVLPPPTGTAPDFIIYGYQLFLQERRLVDAEGRDVVLTAAEFDVFVALLEFRGKLASREQIIELVRRRNWSGNERAIDGIVSRLRRKLPVEGNRPHFIRTVHGAGYMIVH